MSYSLLITDDAKDDIEYLKKAGDILSLKKLAFLLHELTPEQEQDNRRTQI